MIFVQTLCTTFEKERLTKRVKIHMCESCPKIIPRSWRMKKLLLINVGSP